MAKRKKKKKFKKKRRSKKIRSKKKIKKRRKNSSKKTKVFKSKVPRETKDADGNTVFKVPETWSKQAYVNKSQYEKKYKLSIKIKKK